MTAKFEKYLTSCQHCLFFHQHWKVRGPRLQGLPREECPSLGPARSRVGRWCQLCSSPSSSRVHSTITVLWFAPYKRKRSENHSEPPSHGVNNPTGLVPQLSIGRCAGGNMGSFRDVTLSPCCSTNRESRGTHSCFLLLA